MIPDYAAEAFYEYLIPKSVFEGAQNSINAVNTGVDFRIKPALKLFDVSKGSRGRGGRFSCLINLRNGTYLES
jgi:hypothetical protein